MLRYLLYQVPLICWSLRESRPTRWAPITDRVVGGEPSDCWLMLLVGGGVPRESRRQQKGGLTPEDSTTKTARYPADGPSASRFPVPESRRRCRGCCSRCP